MQMPARLRVHGDNACTGGRKLPEITLRRFHHQMNVQRQTGHLAHGTHHQRAKGDVRHKHAVHHVQVYVVRTALLRRANLVGQMAKISRQYRRRQSERVE